MWWTNKKKNISEGKVKKIKEDIVRNKYIIIMSRNKHTNTHAYTHTHIHIHPRKQHNERMYLPFAHDKMESNSEFFRR